MRVIIFSDLEGASGITVMEQCDTTHRMYEEGRRLYTEDVNAAVRGAVAAGAQEVIIKEFHGGEPPYHVNHLIPDALHPASQWIAHYQSRIELIFDQPYDACVLVGFHARSLTANGVLSHTITGLWRRVWIDDVEVGETGIVAALVGFYGTPVVAVAGDVAVGLEAKALLGDSVETIAVKRGYTRTSALIIAPQRSRELIEAGVKAGIENRSAVRPYATSQPCRIRIEAASHEVTAAFAGQPGVTVEDPFHFVVAGSTCIEAVNRLFNLH